MLVKSCYGLKTCSMGNLGDGSVGGYKQLAGAPQAGDHRLKKDISGRQQRA
jgi:hypothetical protein